MSTDTNVTFHAIMLTCEWVNVKKSYMLHVTLFLQYVTFRLRVRSHFGSCVCNAHGCAKVFYLMVKVQLIRNLVHSRQCCTPAAVQWEPPSIALLALTGVQVMHYTHTYTFSDLLFIKCVVLIHSWVVRTWQEHCCFCCCVCEVIYCHCAETFSVFFLHN